MAKLRSILKAVVPPFIWNGLVRILTAKHFKPRWNAVSAGPFAGIKLFFDPKGSWQSKMLAGKYDAFLFNKIKGLAPEGKVIYDIGAHVGFHSLCFAKLVGNSGKVFSFEPNEVNFERLKKNIRDNQDLSGRIKPFDIAVSDSTGTVKFTTSDDIEGGRSTGGFLDKADTHLERHEYSQKGFSDTEVQTIKLDSLPKKLNIPEPDIVKIDVEGAEYQVLLGGREMLRAKKPALFIEVHSTPAMYQVLDFLRSASYETALINKDPNGVCYIQARPK